MALRQLTPMQPVNWAVHALNECLLTILAVRADGAPQQQKIYGRALSRKLYKLNPGLPSDGNQTIMSVNRAPSASRWPWLILVIACCVAIGEKNFISWPKRPIFQLGSGI